MGYYGFFILESIPSIFYYFNNSKKSESKREHYFLKFGFKDLPDKL